MLCVSNIDISLELYKELVCEQAGLTWLLGEEASEFECGSQWQGLFNFLVHSYVQLQEVTQL